MKNLESRVFNSDQTISIHRKLTGIFEWKGKRGVYSSPLSQPVDFGIEATLSSTGSHGKNILWLDHAATRVRAQDRNSAILEFMRLTNYNFDFAIY